VLIDHSVGFYPSLTDNACIFPFLFLSFVLTQSRNYIQHHLNKGAKVLIGGSEAHCQVKSTTEDEVIVSEYHLQPTVLLTPLSVPVGSTPLESDERPTNSNSEISRHLALVDFEETYSPVLHIIAVSDNEMVLAVNEQIHSLNQAYTVVFTSDFSMIHELSHKLAAKTVVFNDVLVNTESHLKG